MDDSNEVSIFMQKASKKTRSYFVNANGLNGFLAPISIIKYLKRAHSQVTRHVEIDMDAVVKLLDQMQTND